MLNENKRDKRFIKAIDWPKWVWQKKGCTADYVVKTCIRLSGICKSIFQSTAICKCKNA